MAFLPSIFRFRKLDRLLFRMYLGPLVLTFFIAIFVLLMQFLWKYVEDLVGKGLDIWVIVQLLFYASATFVPMALPIAILLSSLMTFGSFGENYELAASKSVGISLLKMMRPLIFLSVTISILAFYFSNNVLPYANLKMAALLYDVSNAKPTLNIREGIFYREIDNFVIKVGKRENDGKTIRNIIIYDHTKHTGNTSVTIAQSGFMEMTEDEKFLKLRLFNGYSYHEPLDKREYHKTRPIERIFFKEQYKMFDLSSFAMQKTDEEFFKNHYRMMSIDQLSLSIDSMSSEKLSKKSVYANQIVNYWHFYSHFDSAVIAKHKLDESFVLEKENFLDNFQATEKKIITESALSAAINMHEIIGFQVFELDAINRHFIRFKVEFQRKFTLSVACFILFFIGAPLGAIIRKGGIGLPLVIASLIFVAYYILSITGEKFVREAVWNPMFGMWLSSIVLFPFGLWLTLKTINDSPLMDAESWYKASNKGINTLKKYLKKFKK